MASVYHLLPKNFVGNRLVPLNRMKTTWPDLYAEGLLKYRGREKILDRKIPIIDCLWNDVLHFSAISPELIFNRLEELGLGSFNGIQWFEVPMERIKMFPGVVYRASERPKTDLSIGIENVESLDCLNWTEPTKLSEKADTYFLRCKVENRKPLPFQFTEHILIRGEIIIDELRVISR